MPTAFPEPKMVCQSLHPCTEVHGKLIDRAYGPYQNQSAKTRSNSQGNDSQVKSRQG